MTISKLVSLRGFVSTCVGQSTGSLNVYIKSEEAKSNVLGHIEVLQFLFKYICVYIYTDIYMDYANPKGCINSQSEKLPVLDSKC